MIRSRAGGNGAFPITISSSVCPSLATKGEVVNDWHVSARRNHEIAGWRGGAPLSLETRPRLGAAVAARVGILLADTKFEFGLSGSGELLLIDEVLTPDSSRFWDASAYEPGRAQASYDKQFVRDWLETQPWNKTAPGPELPAEIVAGTRARYVEAFERITGASFTRYLEEDLIAR